MAWSVYRARLRFLRQQTSSEYTQRGVNETEQALQEYRDYLNTAEGRRQMSNVRGATYGFGEYQVFLSIYIGLCSLP